MPSVTLTVNGRTRTVEVEDRRLLADVLRHEFGCFGVHFGCSHGACGCCTVHVNDTPRLACLAFAVQCDGADITTIEGLSGEGGALHALQRAFIDEHGLQCGFCTPGFIMALVPFVERAKEPSEHEIREAMSGNLCRCTGYQGIVEAVRTAIRLRAQTEAA
jgi:aerobic-type carbon monoxide dehydrogenase small subunit (CoxS/CutS family)